MLTVKEWRKAKGYPIVEMAKLLAINPATLVKWEDDPSKIPIGKAYEFCAIVGAKYEQVNFCVDTTRNVGLEED